MKLLLGVFTAILAGYVAAVAVGIDVEREGRILIQDNYYTLVSKLENQSTEIAALKTQLQTQDTNKQAEIDQLKAEMATLKSQKGTHSCMHVCNVITTETMESLKSQRFNDEF